MSKHTDKLDYAIAALDLTDKLVEVIHGFRYRPYFNRRVILARKATLKERDAHLEKLGFEPLKKSDA